MSTYSSPAEYSSSSAVRMHPKPPTLHWGWVLLLDIVTLGLFGRVWMILQALWAEKVNGKSNVVFLAVGYLILSTCILYLTFFTRFALPAEDLSGTDLALRDVTRLGNGLLYLWAVFSLRGQLEKAIGHSLHRGMTFFFGTLYFQYHLRRYGRVAN